MFSTFLSTTFLACALVFTWKPHKRLNIHGSFQIPFSLKIFGEFVVGRIYVSLGVKVNVALEDFFLNLDDVLE